MQIFNSLEEIQNIEKTVVAMGNFDGVHLGHQAIIKKAIADANNEEAKSGVFTFSNHPRNLIKSKENIKNIQYCQDKENILEELGVDYMFNIPFTEDIMRMPPEDFIKNILVDKLNVKEVLCGFNYKFGYMAKGDVDMLIKYGKKYDFGVHITKAYTIDDKVVCSTLIRKFIAKGDITSCNRFLGRNYTIGGKVVVGNRLGKSLGFPTSNLNIDKCMVSPANGVYVTKCIYNGVSYDSITNVGNKPTIGAYNKNVETHIFGFNKEIYGKHIQVEFIDKMRDEIKFENVEELSKQIKKDCQNALAYHQNMKKR